jgi:hypothetical protein
LLIGIFLALHYIAPGKQTVLRLSRAVGHAASTHRLLAQADEQPLSAKATLPDRSAEDAALEAALRSEVARLTPRVTRCFAYLAELGEEIGRTAWERGRWLSWDAISGWTLQNAGAPPLDRAFPYPAGS